MMDTKEQELIEACAEADCNCVETDHKLALAYHKWAEAHRKLWKYRVSKAQQGGKVGGMKAAKSVVTGTVGAIVRPAFWITLAAGYWGPDYPAWDDGLVWDVLIRFVLSMATACVAVRSLMSNSLLARSDSYNTATSGQGKG